MQYTLPSYCYATEAIVTPLAPVPIEEDGRVIWCKLEYHNPSGSTKDRIARFILGKAIRCGRLKPGMKVVEASSGSTSIAMALMSAQFQLRFIAVMPSGVSSERVQLIKAFGAEVELTDAELGMPGAMEGAELIAAEQNAFFPKQFENPDNPAAHRHQTAAEIICQVPTRRVDAIVSGVGTGGTLVGLHQGLSDYGCQPRAVLARPICKNNLYEPECCSFSHKIPGVVKGESKILQQGRPDNLETVSIDDHEALEWCRVLNRKGFPVGPSAGLNFAAALKVARKLSPNDTVVTIFPDRIERYLSTGLLDNDSSEQRSESHYGGS